MSNSTTNPDQPNATVTGAGRGETLDIMGQAVEVKLRGRDTGGAMSMFELVAQPGDGVPSHRHTHEAELFHVIEGTVRFVSNGDETRGGPGTTVYLPIGGTHEWWVEGDQPARVLLMTLPGTFDAFFDELQTAGRNLDQVVAISQKFGITFA